MEYLRIGDFRNRNADSYTLAVRIENTAQVKECSEDYLLPDYLPDAKKVIRISAKPTVDRRFCGKGSMDYSGCINVKILYMAEDGSLAGCSFPISFEDRLTSEKISDECVDFITPKIISASCRLQNPRKLKAIIRLSNSIEIWKRESVLPELYGERSKSELDCLETDVRLVNALNVTGISEDEMILEESISLDKSLPDISTVLFSDIDIYFDECRSSKKEIICKGTGRLSVVYKSDDGRICSFIKDIPFSESIIAPGSEDGKVCSDSVFVRSLDVSLREDEFGQMRNLDIRALYSAQIRMLGNKALALTFDAFSTKSECRCDESSLCLINDEEKIDGNFSVNESFSLKDLGIGADDIPLIYYSDTGMLLQNTPGSHGKMLFEGKSTITLILKKPDKSCYSVVFDLPLKYESDKKYIVGSVYDEQTSAETSSLRIRPDGEKLYVDAEIILSSVVAVCRDIPYVSGIHLTPSVGSGIKKPAFTVCYPAKSDDIWSLSKKYSVKRDDLAGENAIVGAELPEILLIPG